jgi:PAS domain S-box-containing protein
MSEEGSAPSRAGSGAALTATRKEVAALAAALLLLGLGVSASFWSFGQITETAQARAPASAAVNSAADLMSALGDRVPRAEVNRFLQLQEASLRQREAESQANILRLLPVAGGASLLVLVSALVLAWLIHGRRPQRRGSAAHNETRHLLDVEEAINKQLQQANMILRDSEEKLAVTLNSIGDAVIATDGEGRVTRLNPVAEKLTGWTQAAAIGRPVSDVFHIVNMETRQSATIPVMETLQKGTIQGLANHTVLIAADGSECDIADSCAPIRDRDGLVVGAVLVFRDVTDDYAAQQALRDSAALIEAILNTVVDGIITLHSRGGIIETVNPAAEKMFGYGAAELVGRAFSLLIPELARSNDNVSLDYYRASAEERAMGLGREVVGRRQDGAVSPWRSPSTKCGWEASVISPGSCAISRRASWPKRRC